MQDLKDRVVRAVDELGAELLDVARQIHARPELAFEERFASDLLCRTLERHGLSPERAAYGLETSFRCDIGDEGPVVAILSEYDALPEMGHACGHNLIAAMGLGAALALAKVGGFRGRIRYLGTPAEEYGAGKAVMAARGAFDGLDAALMVHPANVDLESYPTFCVTAVKATFRGKPAHASLSPEQGINALDACVSAYQSIAQLRQHIDSLARVHGIITYGGAAPNIVPERAEAEYFIRAKSESALENLKARVRACLEAGAAGAGATVELKWWDHPYLDLRSNQSLATSYRKNAEALGRTFFPVAMIPAHIRGSTDMGNVSHLVPSIHPTITVAPPETGIHTACFAHCAASETGDKGTLDGAKAMAMTVIDFFLNEDLRSAVAKDFKKSAAAA
ncbi:M20 family metallopeptidase [Solimonas terrae]|uniref:Peptidase M20 domain-containing protein 2 n=1 Tax=Solimonas terrae TaxID=1396819 RepID=A0A6M2BKH7_9GAMM|nr:M20 family metallopeptidase [Solimonas terrae]NGY03342.1 M20 family metallopeptidase [Solimonas terrae]